MIIIGKEKFIEIITRTREVYDYHSNLNKFFSENGTDGYLFQPDCIGNVVDLLHLMFGTADAEEWISYFCFDLDFGRAWEPGMIKSIDGDDIKLQTADDLYNFLVKEHENGL